MPEPLVVTIPHQLGREEAARRIRTGLERMRGSFGHVTAVQENWSGDHLDFIWSALGQTIRGGLDVAADNVRIEVHLPWLLARLADKAKGMLRQQGQVLLEKR